MTDTQEEPLGEFEGIPIHSVEVLPLADLRPHPKNYRTHPPDQMVHLRASLRQHGWYRNIVVARDLTVLGGHGIREAAMSLGAREGPVIRLECDPDDPEALRVLAGDNELPKMAEVNDRALSELLVSLRELDPLGGLVGTGFDDQMLANLVFVTRPASEIGTINEAALWAGMPEFEAGDNTGYVLVFHCDTEEERDKLIAETGVTISKKMRRTWSCWWPPMKRQDLASFRFEDAAPEDGSAGEPAPPEPATADG